MSKPQTAIALLTDTMLGIHASRVLDLDTALTNAQAAMALGNTAEAKTALLEARAALTSLGQSFERYVKSLEPAKPRDPKTPTQEVARPGA